MLKRLNLIEKAVTISKQDQIAINGGSPGTGGNCDTVCPTASSGTYCLFGGHSGCPAVCNGKGGYVIL